VNIDYFPAAAWPTCVKHTDTNSAGRSAATGCFSGKGLPAGRVISGAPPHDGALPSRTARARFFFLRLRNAISARVLTGTELNAVSPATMRTDDVTGFRLQLPPQPAQSGAGLAYVLQPEPVRAAFFFCPRRNHSSNSRGLRLAWLLGIDELCRRRSAADDTGLQ